MVGYTLFGAAEASNSVDSEASVDGNVRWLGEGEGGTLFPLADPFFDRPKTLPNMSKTMLSEV